jgi:hypothetical protein
MGYLGVCRDNRQPGQPQPGTVRKNVKAGSRKLSHGESE